MRYTLTRAAELAAAAYEGKSHPIIAPQWKASLHNEDVEAHILTDDTVLIPGSNSISDYLRYNLRIERLGKRRLRMPNAPDGMTWHQGFLAHAKVVQDWILDNGFQPSFFIGHSLGAASAQILSAGWRVPAIAFAAPRPCRTRAAAAAARLCLCVNRSDDRVCELPRGFFHLGEVRPLAPKVRNRGQDHSMVHYRSSVAEGLAAGQLPRVWPA